MSDPRTLLLELYAAGLKAVDGRTLVRNKLSDGVFNERAVHLLAVGKAAASMALGARDALGDKLVDGLVITKRGHSSSELEQANFIQLESAHPVPDERSLKAGARLQEYLCALPESEPLLVLISGGASSLVEVLAEGVEPHDWFRANEWLLGSGWPIGRMNALRKQLSRIKGGRLIDLVGEREVFQLLLSDVIGNNPAVIGSGPLVFDPGPGVRLHGLPDWLSDCIVNASQPKPFAEQRFRRVTTHLLADNRTALATINCHAEKLGIHVYEHDVALQGSAVNLGRELGRWLRSAPPGLHLWGGETTVVLPEEPGQGGRCQALALAAAEEIAGCDHIWLLAGTTDGSDGPTDDAGALVDGGSWKRAIGEGYDPKSELERANSGPVLSATGDLLFTGPTGSNVMDLLLAWVN